ncbi:unnamed protein product [Allacma fusca]|uniref:Uncharacterized protein n=1 Tax=Allacma fusca TaxID=39272 RepID=A0A8J2KWN7_9HEXA|nr:unnamed protein product [Allacma fusca]
MAETPSKQLSARLDRLEKDLQLLSTMQTFIVSDTVPLSYNPPTRDFPERDINTGYRDTSSRSSSERTTCQHDPSVGKENAPSNKSGPRRVIKPKVVKSMEVVGVSSISTVSRSTLTDEPFPSNLQLEVSEALKSERKRRVDVEDSARIVALKLQQFEDELKKERESKQMLLVGMLQCKNKISGQEMLMKEREVELKQAQEESASSQLKLERITAENIATVEKLKQLIDLLKTEKKVLQAENRKMAAEKREIESRIEESCKQSAMYVLGQKEFTLYKLIFPSMFTYF